MTGRGLPSSLDRASFALWPSSPSYLTHSRFVITGENLNYCQDEKLLLLGTVLLEHVVISNFRLFSPGVVFTVMTVFVAIDRDAIAENSAHLPWSGSIEIKIKIQMF